MEYKITLDLGESLNNFSLAHALYKLCKDENLELDAEAFCNMLMSQVNSDRTMTTIKNKKIFGFKNEEEEQ